MRDSNSFRADVYLQGSHCCCVVGESQRSRSHWLQRSDVLESANRDKISYKELKHLKLLKSIIGVLLAYNSDRAGQYN